MLFAEVPAPTSEPPPTTTAASTVELIAGTSHTNKVEIMEVMKKLDADLVALFAAEPLLEHQMKKKQELWQQQPPQQQQQQQQHLDKQEPVQQQQQQQELEPLQQEEELQKLQIYSKDDTLQLFKQCNALQLHLEALTLQPEGTERMELLQTEIRPIFTVECQLSEELIKLVERYPMFHVMQFESEKFQSLTQCTRFNQVAQREVHLDHLSSALSSSSLVDVNDENNGTAKKEKEEVMMGFGHIDFTVWWREPGTCLNEMLGLGRLQLKELYEASLLEQCKCIPIKRRDNHFASLYLKISLLNKNTNSTITTTTISSNNNNVEEKEQTQSNNNNNNTTSSKGNNNSSSSDDDTTNKSSAPGEYI